MDDFKEIGHDLWKNKPLLIALAIGVVAVVYILVKNSQGQLAASTLPTTMATGSTLPMGAGGTYVENSYTTYAPTSTTTTTTTNPIQTITAPITSTAAAVYKTIKSGSLETTPRDTAGGHNILTVPKGVSVSYVSGPVPDPQGTSKKYYVVNYQGKTGYIGSDVLGGMS